MHSGNASSETPCQCLITVTADSPVARKRKQMVICSATDNGCLQFVCIFSNSSLNDTTRASNVLGFIRKYCNSNTKVT